MQANLCSLFQILHLQDRLSHELKKSKARNCDYLALGIEFHAGECVISWCDIVIVNYLVQDS